MSYNLTWIGNNLAIHMFGNVGISEIEEINDLIYGNYRFDSMKYQILDLTKITNINFDLDTTSDEITPIISLEKSAARWNNSIKIAIVSTNDILKPLIFKYASGISESGWICEQFDTFEIAQKWCTE